MGTPTARQDAKAARTSRRKGLVAGSRYGILVLLMYLVVGIAVGTVTLFVVAALAVYWTTVVRRTPHHPSISAYVARPVHHVRRMSARLA
jgi:hypothetical protein